eukprot:m.81130 g.81130  ORF g.81130 m.81130 type:complete len:50 (+) comp25387_c0_seq1:882-1031(+)
MPIFAGGIIRTLMNVKRIAMGSRTVNIFGGMFRDEPPNGSCSFDFIVLV